MQVGVPHRLEALTVELVEVESVQEEGYVKGEEEEQLETEVEEQVEEKVEEEVE